MSLPEFPQDIARQAVEAASLFGGSGGAKRSFEAIDPRQFSGLSFQSADIIGTPLVGRDSALATAVGSHAPKGRGI